jgi:glycosyltransferase involved in cell wall biosynthesis
MSQALVIGDVGTALVRVLEAAGLTATVGTDAGEQAIAEAALVMCATEDQRTALEQEFPAAAGKTFTADSPARFLTRASVVEPAEDAVRVAVVGYNLKFIEPLIARWRGNRRLDVMVDRWRRFRVHDDDATHAAIDAADVIVCEWCGPNAVIASHRKRGNQRLIVRLHRFELYEDEWRDIAIDAVDTVITVGEEYRRRVIATTGWPSEKVVVIPNAVDDLQLSRPKLAGSRFRMGFVSPATSRKRIDLALDVLEEVRRHDPRYTMSVKGEMPWSSKWVADRPDEVRYFAQIADRLAARRLGHAVVFEPPGPDVAAWLRGIGWMLSTSDDESFHLAPAEAMASGAVPVIKPWPGADKVFPFEWLLPDTTAMAHRVLDVGSSEPQWATAGTRARRQVLERYGFDEVAPHWDTLLLGGGSG